MLARKYKRLRNSNESLGKVSQALRDQNGELGSEIDDKDAEIEELNSDAQELAHMVRIKEGVIEDLKTSLVAAKKKNC